MKVFSKNFDYFFINNIEKNKHSGHQLSCFKNAPRKLHFSFDQAEPKILCMFDPFFRSFIIIICQISFYNSMFKKRSIG